MIIKKILATATAATLLMSSLSFAQEPQISSKSAILIDEASGKVLYAKEDSMRTYPASITKVLTSIISLEKLNLEKEVTVSDEIYYVAGNASKINLKLGDKLKVKDLVASLILRSANDSAYVLAREVIRETTGDPDVSAKDAVVKFAELMNAKAKEIGAVNTKFENPDGYHDPEHYTNAYDLALIAANAMKNEYFRNLASIDVYQSEFQTESWVNRNLLLEKDSEFYYQYATGIKTGHTEEAGYTLASSATKGGINLIAITLGGTLEEDRWNDTIKIFDYGFNNFVLHSLCTIKEPVDKAKVVKRFIPLSSKLDVKVLDDMDIVVAKEDVSKIRTVFEYSEDVLKSTKKGTVLRAPIESGQILGEAKYYLGENLIGSAQLVAGNDAGTLNKFEEKIYWLDDLAKDNWIISIFIFIFVIFVISFSYRKIKESKRRRRGKLRF